MLEIQTPPGCETERAYILGVLFDDWLGLPYRLTQTARDDVCIRLTDQPGELRLPDGFFSQFREAPEAWLSDASLPLLYPRRYPPGCLPINTAGDCGTALDRLWAGQLRVGLSAGA